MSFLHDAIQAGVLAALRGLCVGMPGRLEAYDPTTGKGEVKPLIQEPDHSGAFRPLKPIRGVPVAMLGGGQAAVYLPPEVGDTGWMAFSHRSLELWLARGGDQPAGDPRVMDMTDAVFFPGLRPFAEGSLAEEPDAAVFRNGRAKLKLRGDRVALGNDVAELLDLFDQLLTQLTVTGNVIVSLTTGIGGLNPATLALVQAIQVKLGLIKGTL